MRRKIKNAISYLVLISMLVSSMAVNVSAEDAEVSDSISTAAESEETFTYEEADPVDEDTGSAVTESTETALPDESTSQPETDDASSNEENAEEEASSEAGAEEEDTQDAAELARLYVEACLKDFEASDDRNRDVAEIAGRLIGYSESEEDSVLDEDTGERYGYTYFGDWYGKPYADWNTLFAGYVLSYAGITDLKFDEDPGKWLDVVKKEETLFRDPDDYEPETGDILFWEDEKEGIRVGFLSGYDTDKDLLYVIEGDVSGTVSEEKYSTEDLKLIDVELVTPEEPEEKEPEEELTERVVEGEDYTITVSYGKEANIPKDAVLTAEEITEEDGSYEEYLRSAADALEKSESSVTFCRFFDISFFVEGEEIEPEAQIEIRIAYRENPAIGEDADCSVVHFAESGIEVLGLSNEPEMVEEEGFLFTQESLSVVGTIITETPTSFVNGERYMFYENYNGTMYALYSTGNTVSAKEIIKDTSGYLVPKDSTLNIEGFFWTYEGSGGTGTTTAKLKNADGQYLALGDSYPAVLEAYYARNLTLIPGTKDGTGSVQIKGVGYYADYYLQLDGSGFYDKRTRDGIYELKVANRADVIYSDIQIVDDIKASGNLKVDYAGDTSNVSYVWYKKKTGSGDEWEQVSRKLVTEINGTRLYNIDEDGALNVALDEGEGYTYKVVLASKDGTPLTDDSGAFLTESAAYEIPYYASLQNGSFETPDARTDYGYYSDTQIGGARVARTVAGYQPFYIGGTDNIVWNTTASDGLIEVIRPDASQSTSRRTWQQYSITWHNVEAASDGAQYAELNAEAAGALYQDVLTIPGTTMHWSLDHRGRGPNGSWDYNPYYRNSNTYDTMYLLIMPTALAEEIDTQEEVNYVMSHLDEYPGAYVQSMTDNNLSWVNHRGDYTVPEGQYLTRYFFVSGATSSGNNTTGNHLDNVWFSTELPDPPDGSVAIQVRKRIEGNLTDDELLALKDQITIDYTLNSTVNSNHKEGTIKGSDSTLTNGTFTEVLTIEADGIANFTVTENTDNIDVDGYTRTTTIKVVEDDVEGQNASVSGTVSDGKVRTVEIVNSYQKIYKLPTTGGRGTLLLTLGGSAFMTSAWLLYVEDKKRKYAKS